MLPEELDLVWRKYKNKVFIYAWEYFTKRIHDESIRSVLDESPFFFVEIKFEVIQKELQAGDERLKFWKAFFELLSMQKRGCDLCGFLNNDEGIALLFVDSALDAKDSNSNPAWGRFCSEMRVKTLVDMQKWDGITYGEYPPKEFFALNRQV